MGNDFMKDKEVKLKNELKKKDSESGYEHLERLRKIAIQNEKIKENERKSQFERDIIQYLNKAWDRFIVGIANSRNSEAVCGSYFEKVIFERWLEFYHPTYVGLIDLKYTYSNMYLELLNPVTLSIKKENSEEGEEGR
jgi:hypothetical protein